EQPGAGTVAAAVEPGIGVERVVGDEPVQAAHCRVKAVAYGMPLAPWQDGQVAVAEPHRIRAGEPQPATAIEDYVELGRAGVVHSNPPGGARAGTPFPAAPPRRGGERPGPVVIWGGFKHLPPGPPRDRLDNRIALPSIASRTSDPEMLPGGPPGPSCPTP